MSSATPRAIQPTVADRGLEGLALPELQRLGGLHVVVAVGEEGLVAFAGLGVDYGVSFGFHDRSSGAGLFELTRHPFGALAEARAVILSGGDRGHPQELLELAEEGVSLAVHVLSQVHPRKSFLLPSERVASSVFRAIDDRGPRPMCWYILG